MAKCDRETRSVISQSSRPLLIIMASYQCPLIALYPRAVAVFANNDGDAIYGQVIKYNRKPFFSLTFGRVSLSVHVEHYHRNLSYKLLSGLRDADHSLPIIIFVRLLCLLQTSGVPDCHKDHITFSRSSTITHASLASVRSTA